MGTPTAKKSVSLSLRQQYNQLVAKGKLKDDPAQHAVLAALEALTQALSKPSVGLSRLLKKDEVNGLYVWGQVGRGKSMLMDLFFQAAPVKHKRRVHFHAFMQEVHAELHKLRQKKAADPVATLAKKIGKDTRLLCFDELQATDVADASLLYRLFSGLFEAGITIVSTSNRPPESLYTGGVQRERFANFIALINERMQVIALDSPTDYRHTQMQAMKKTYVFPLGKTADHFVTDAISHLCSNIQPHQDVLHVQGRKVPITLYDNAIGRFSFQELCETPLGPADYLALAERLDTLILTGIPRLTPEKRNEAKRFVTLIDALYEHKVKLLATAEGPPEEIYSHGDGTFEFKRTVSRLKEMQSAKWFAE
jgi:cell division protein ZapE